MANTQISAAQLNERGGHIHVTGKVNYSRVTSIIEGDELARRVQNSRSMYPQTKPHVSLTLSDASVLPVSGDINQLTTEEFYVQERRYASSKPEDGETGFRYNIEPTINRPEFLPSIWRRTSNTPDDQGQYHYTQVTEPEGELAKGTPVRLVLRVFRAGENVNRGLAIQGLYIEDDQVNYAVSHARAELASRGIILDAEPVATAATEDSSGSSQSADDTTGDDGLPMPVIGGQGQSQGQSQPQPNQQASAPVPAQPAQPAQPQAQSAPQAPAQPAVQQQAPVQNAAPQGQPAPAQPAQPAPQQAPAQPAQAPQQPDNNQAAQAPSVFPQTTGTGIAYE